MSIVTPTFRQQSNEIHRVNVPLDMPGARELYE